MTQAKAGSVGPRAGDDGRAQAAGLGNRRNAAQPVGRPAATGQQRAIGPSGQVGCAETGQPVHAHGDRMAFRAALHGGHEGRLARTGPAATLAAPVGVVRLDLVGNQS
ncbi:hypothetical protein ACFQGW_19785 [Xanthomonas theicola]